MSQKDLPREQDNYSNDAVKRNSTPNCTACIQGVHAVVALIIEQKTTMEQKDKDYKTALQIARGRKQESIVKLLLASGARDIESAGRPSSLRKPLSWGVL